MNVSHASRRERLKPATPIPIAAIAAAAIRLRSYHCPAVAEAHALEIVGWPSVRQKPFLKKANNAVPSQRSTKPSAVGTESRRDCASDIGSRSPVGAVWLLRVNVSGYQHGGDANGRETAHGHPAPSRNGIHKAILPQSG